MSLHRSTYYKFRILGAGELAWATSSALAGIDVVPSANSFIINETLSDEIRETSVVSVEGLHDVCDLEANQVSFEDLTVGVIFEIRVEDDKFHLVGIRLHK